MRVGSRFPAALVLAVAAACAQVVPPPGGPEDRDGPKLVATRPDTMAQLRSYQGEVVFVFDEGLSEIGIDTLVLVSPAGGSPDADKDGDEIRVALRRGWQPGRIYQVTVLPGVQDRFGNRTAAPIHLVFSTGPEIPSTRLTGSVIDRATLQPLRGGWVEAILRPDSLPYLARTDSAGGFVFTRIPPGEYGVRAYADNNRSRSLDEFEPRDTASARVAAGDSARVPRLATVLPDTSPPRAGTATGTGDLVEVKFDDYLDPAQPLAPSQVTLTGPDGAAVQVLAVRIGPFAEVARDSAAAAGDSAASRPAAAAAPQEPVPSQSLFVRTAAALAPETDYRVSVSGVRNLLGLAGGGEARFRTPRRAPAPAPAPAPAEGAPPVQPRPPVAPPRR
ncbi:MAG TPA: Ig-like domain-containing protein [Longimicrobiaceae bacterium]|nr:Ig-like domain-containing protein [Longimicrobiaceae bacterium]